MKDRFKIIISNRNLYKEIELPPDVQSIRLGTGIECDVRLRKELFFENIELLFTYGQSWSVVCSDNLYISVGDVRKLMTKELAHGDVLSVRYQESNNELFTIEFVIDFEYENKNYDRLIDISAAQHIKIGGSDDAQIYFEDAYVGKDEIL